MKVKIVIQLDTANLNITTRKIWEHRLPYMAGDKNHRQKDLKHIIEDWDYLDKRFHSIIEIKEE